MRFNDDWFGFMQQIIAMRKNNPVLSHGELEYLIVDDAREVLAYSRYNDDQEIITIFNASENPVTVEVPARVSSMYKTLMYESTFTQTDNMIEVELPARSAAVLSSK